MTIAMECKCNSTSGSPGAPQSSFLPTWLTHFPVKELLPTGRAPVGIKVQQSPPTLRDSPSRWVNGYHGLNDHNQGEIEQVKIYYSSCVFNTSRPKQLSYRHFFCIFIGQTALLEKNVDVTNLTKQHRFSDLDYQLRKVEVNPIQAASGNWLDRNPENVKLSECHISLQVTMVKYVLRLKKDFVRIFSSSTALYIIDLEIVANVPPLYQIGTANC